MNKIIKPEQVTQNQIIELFTGDKLGYYHVINWWQ